MNFTLYQLDGQERRLMDALEESGGEITPDMEEEYAELLQARGEKVASYIKVIRSSEAYAEGVDAEIKRLTSLKSAAQNTAKRLKERLLLSMQERGDTEYVTPIGKVKVQRAGAKPVLLHEGTTTEALPDEFKRVTVAPDLKAIGDALKAGDETAMRFAQFGEQSTYVRIY